MNNFLETRPTPDQEWQGEHAYPNWLSTVHREILNALAPYPTLKQQLIDALTKETGSDEPIMLHYDAPVLVEPVILFQDILGYFRIHKDATFDIPAPKLKEELKEKFLIRGSRRYLFERMSVKLKSTDSENGQVQASALVFRWNLDHLHTFMQIGIATLDSEGTPQYRQRIIITGNADELAQPPIHESVPLPETQEDVYWQVVLEAARIGMSEGYFPYAALVEPAGAFNEIIIARNRNHEMGEGFHGHAEHMSLSEMQDKGYKDTHQKLRDDGQFLNPLYRPRLFSLVCPCHACSQMAREQTVAEVHYLLQQPPGWSGEAILSDSTLTNDCGIPPYVSQETNYKNVAPGLLEEANGHYYHNRGKFWDTIRANGGT